jgi:hypothetical protein
MTGKPGKPERHPITGGVVAYDPLVRKYVILDCTGAEHGYRRGHEDAMALAASLPGSPWEPAPPSPIHRSPRATGTWGEGGQRAEYQPPGPQPEELPISTKPQPRVVRVRPR